MRCIEWLKCDIGQFIDRKSCRETVLNALISADQAGVATFIVFYYGINIQVWCGGSGNSPLSITFTPSFFH